MKKKVTKTEYLDYIFSILTDFGVVVTKEIKEEFFALKTKSEICYKKRQTNKRNPKRRITWQSKLKQ